MLFNIKVQDQAISKNQEVYNAINEGNKLTARFIQSSTSDQLARSSDNSALNGVVATSEGKQYPVSEGLLGTIVEFNGDGQISSFSPEGSVVRGDYTKVIGMTIAIFCTAEEVEYIQKVMTEKGVKAVDVTFNASPLNLWTTTSGTVSANAYGVVTDITPLALDITTSRVHINNVDGEQVRRQQAEALMAKTERKLSARRGAVAQTAKPTIDLSTLSQSAVTTVQ